MKDFERRGEEERTKAGRALDFFLQFLFYPVARLVMLKFKGAVPRLLSLWSFFWTVKERLCLVQIIREYTLRGELEAAKVNEHKNYFSELGAPNKFRDILTDNVVKPKRCRAVSKHGVPNPRANNLSRRCKPRKPYHVRCGVPSFKWVQLAKYLTYFTISRGDNVTFNC